MRIACPFCGSLLGSADRKEQGPPSKFAVLEKLAAVPFKPALAVGSEGTLRGHKYAILGAVQKTTSSGGEDYFWTEYLLKEEKSEAYHWLAESNGHYTLLEPVPRARSRTGRASPSSAAPLTASSRAATARVAGVLGEFYWTIRNGETTEATDYIKPPRMLSKEKAKKEIAWTEGAYVPPGEIAAAFALKEPLPPPEGVGATQPWPHADTSHLWWKTAWLLSLASIVVFFLAKLLTPHAVVYDRTFDLTDPQRLIYAARGGAKLDFGRLGAGQRDPEPGFESGEPGSGARGRRSRALGGARPHFGAFRDETRRESRRGPLGAHEQHLGRGGVRPHLGGDRRGPLVRPDLGPILGRRRGRELERRQPEPPHLRAAHSRGKMDPAPRAGSPSPGRRRPRSASG